MDKTAAQMVEASPTPNITDMFISDHGLPIRFIQEFMCTCICELMLQGITIYCNLENEVQRNEIKRILT
ncbi:hypothetical protein Ciccas_014517 [Cichlidogyrus casuarinus]|uniref:Uncharacterized protein n=1 Tax=Cichlidogyrus casuarinus TaxID=1844966 RepID=A0ABD2PIQ4_9PLAT